jgi:hypothetical protein
MDPRSVRHEEEQATVKQKKSEAKMLRTIVGSLKLFIHNWTYVSLFVRVGKPKRILALANMKIASLGESHPAFGDLVDEFNTAAIEITKVKWYGTEGLLASDKETRKMLYRKARNALRRAHELAKMIAIDAAGGKGRTGLCDSVELSDKGTEITFADGVPLIPEICPVVVLQGDDLQMGRQYVEQLVEIFGPWIIERKAGRCFTEKEVAVIRRWEQQLQVHTPEILRFIEGMVEGAEELGIPLTYLDALEMWTGKTEPAQYYMGKGEAIKELPPMACSGCCAWGDATVDGSLFAAASGDHDCGYMVVIAAYPEDGNAFILSPFAATGDLPFIGNTQMFGHPGMNDKGVAYVEHGGLPRMIEPIDSWGYGLRKEAGVIHALRYCDSALEVRDLELSWPVGDVGRDTGTVGGFFADSSYGYVLESRLDPVIIRESGDLGERSFLYASNSALHPKVQHAEWMRMERDNWEWVPPGGWRPKKFRPTSLFSGTGRARQISTFMTHSYHHSWQRNSHFYSYLNDHFGIIDTQVMKEIYRKGCVLPEKSWKEIVSHYKKTGYWGYVSAAHTGNACVTVLNANNGDRGVFSTCIGMARRGMAPATIFDVNINVYHNETNAFWELTLAASPEAMSDAARVKARKELAEAEDLFATSDVQGSARRRLETLLGQCRAEVRLGGDLSAAPRTVGQYAKTIRAHTRAQIRARQVIRCCRENNADGTK